MKNKNILVMVIAWILVGILTSLLVFQSVRKFDCSSCVSDVDTVWKYVQNTDTVFTRIEVKVPMPYKVVDSVLVPYLVVDTMPVDTGLIISQFVRGCSAHKYYSDTIADDYIIAVIYEHLHQNSIVDRNFSYALVGHDVETQTTTIEPNRGAFYVGPVIGRSVNEFGVGLGLQYQNKKDDLIGVSYDVLNKDMYVNYYKRITWKRKE